MAALGAAGFGLAKELPPAHLFLALILFVCFYVDLLCTNLKVRVIVIGTFYAEFRRDVYECYVQRNRNAFQMEDWALYLSTYAVCFLLIVIGLLSKTFANLALDWPLHWQRPSGEDDVLIIAGLIGLGLAWLTDFRSRWLLEHLVPQADALEIQNRKIAGYLRATYTSRELQALGDFLVQKGVFIFQSLPNGLFSAAASAKSGDVSGYQHVWVRDNIHVAHAHYICGDETSAGRTLSVLMHYFQKYRNRFRHIIADWEEDKEKAIAADPMNRPHVRFGGRELVEIQQGWAHAQNDALGYFLWCYCKLAQK